MGVADNRSYKDEYLFQDDKYDITAEQPSIHEEPNVNTTIKENPYRSNVEIEGGEIILKPDLSALFKASGPRHSKGGMDVLLKPDSFIFSDFKGLALKGKDFETLELKEGGKTNTPADVLKKNVDVKHYNSLVNILDDPYTDDLAKKSAAMMLEKYLQSLGNIAYAQEKKKGFPQGLPAFSNGTAPVYDPSVKDKIMENKQYMKAGGTIHNPYYQGGGRAAASVGARNPTTYFQNGVGYDTSRSVNGTSNPGNMYITGSQPNNYTGYDYAGRGYWKNGTLYPSLQAANGTGGGNSITPPPQNNQTNTLDNAKNPIPWGLWQGDNQPLFQDRYGITNAADKFDKLKNWDAVTKSLGYTGPKDNLEFQKWLYNSSPENAAIIDKWHNQYNLGPTQGKFDQRVGVRWANAIGEIMDKKKPLVSTAPDCPCGLDRFGQCIPCDEAKTQVPGPQVPGIDATPQGSKQADWRFTPWQKLSHLWNWGQAAMVSREMPYRSRYNATFVDPALVNPEQAVGDIKGFGNQQLSSLTTLNPILRNAQAASISGQIMNQLPGTRAQYDNQNAQILNQTRQYNNQVKNNESLVNLGYDQQYYKEAVEGRKNFSNARQFAANNAMNNVLGDVTTNQRLAYNLLTQKNPAYGFDWNTGNFYRNPKSIIDVQGNATNERYNDLLKLIDSISDPTEKAKLMLKLEGIKTFGSAEQNPNLFKKGGKIRNPYRY